MKLRTWCIRIGQILTKTVLVCTGFLVFLTLFNPVTAQAGDDRGGITIRQQNVPIQKVFQTIEKQSGYRFFYNETLLQGSAKVSLNLQNVSLQVALEACFRNQPLSYAIVDKTIIVKRRLGQQSTAPVTAAVSVSKPGKIIAVRGKVTSNNLPVVGASIMIKGTDNGVSTDKDGMFTLPEVDEEATLVISSVSHAAREVRLNGQTFINIDLSKRTDDLDEAVVVAYNTTTVKRNVGAVTVVKGDQIQSLPNRSFDKSLQGMVPGLLVTKGSGQPGGGLGDFVLRGIATGGNPVNGGTSRNPLIVIDGIPIFQDPVQAVTSTITFHNPIAQINPSDIETITVLKDAAAVALYGARASNGVILVTTKHGKAGRTTFGLRHQTDFSERLGGKIRTLNHEEYMELLYETYKNTNQALWNDAAIKSDLLKKFPYYVAAPGDTSFYSPSDWLDALYRDWAPTISNEISISGGNEKSNYYLNLEYTKQTGVEKKTDFDRKSIRFNYENRPTAWFKFGSNSTLSYSVQNYSYEGHSEVASLLISPLNPIRQPDGNYIYNYTWGFSPPSNLNSNSTYIANPVAGADLNINRNISYRGISKLYGEFRFLKSFSFTSNVGIDFMLTEAKQKTSPLLAASSLNPGIGRVIGKDLRNANVITTNILRFDKTIVHDHNINVLFGQEAQVLTNNFMAITRTNLTADPLSDQLSVGTVSDAAGGHSKQTLLSYFSQANYSFRDKYFVSGSVRRDGSSLFGDNRRFGTHWSAGAGWVLTNEPFMKRITGWLEYLKLRGSIGSNGNSAAILNSLRYDKLYRNDYRNTTALYPNQFSSPGNPGIQWEKTVTWDAGMELRILRERLGITADIYNRKTSEVIGQVDLPLTTGFTTIMDNIGDLRNAGIELSIYADIIKSNNFKWNIRANWSKNENKLTKSFFPLEKLNWTNVLVNGEGENYNSYYMPRWFGVDPETGKPQWVDSTGKANSNYDAAKPEFVGKPQPNGFGSVINTVSYKGFELSAMVYYQYGSKIFYGGSAFPNSLVNDGLNPFINQSKEALNRWQKPGDIAINPRRLLFGNINGISDNSTKPSTRFLSDGSFIRLSNVILSYTLPKTSLANLRLNSVKIFIQGNNLATWTNFNGQDPETTASTGQSIHVYPIQRSYTVGANMSF